MDWAQFDWITIAIIAAGAGIGALFGAMVGALAGGPRGLLALVFAVAGGAVGQAYGPDILEPIIGSRLRDASGQTAQLEAALRTLKDDPLVAAIFGDDPAVEERARGRLLEAWRRGGADELRREGARIGAEQSVRVRLYLTHTDEISLIAYVRETIEIAEYLSDRAPELCYDWFYGGARAQGFDVAHFDSVIGAGRRDRLYDTMVGVVRNAADRSRPYDRRAAEPVVDQAREILRAHLGEQHLGLVTGARTPNGESDARLACEATAAMYDYVLDQPRAADALRMMFSGGGP